MPFLWTCYYFISQSFRLFMRGTISECLASLQRCCVSPLLFQKAKCLGCNADRQLSLSPSTPQQSTLLNWGREETASVSCVQKSVCELSVMSTCAENDRTCVTTWLLFALCVKINVYVSAAEIGQSGGNGEILLSWTLEQNQKPQK